MWPLFSGGPVRRHLLHTPPRPSASTTCEVMWVVNVLKDLKVECLLHAKLFCDNSSEIAAIHVFNEKTKHFGIDVHLVREKVSSSVIKTVKVASVD